MLILIAAVVIILAFGGRALNVVGDLLAQLFIAGVVIFVAYNIGVGIASDDPDTATKITLGSLAAFGVAAVFLRLRRHSAPRRHRTYDDDPALTGW
jgi:hypothetical protein